MNFSDKKIFLVVEGINHPIKKFSKIEVVGSLMPVLNNCAKSYLGVPERNLSGEVVASIAKFTKEKFGQLGVNEINLAFTMAAAGEFSSLNITPYYGTFSAVNVGAILNAYVTDTRNKIIQALDAAKKKIEEERTEEEITNKNQKAREEIINEFKAAIEMKKEGIHKFQSWDEVPVHWGKVLIESGIIIYNAEEKKELYKRAKILAYKQIRERMNMEGLTMFEKVSLKKIIEKLDSDGDCEELKSLATSVYSKLVVWIHLEPSPLEK